MTKAKKKENLTDNVEVVERKVKTPESMYFQVKLDQGTEAYEGSGITIFDALSSVPLEWNKVKSKGTIKISKDGKTYEHLFYLKQLRRLFANKLTRNIFAKNLTYLFANKAQ